jgi:hypothetical protein
MLGQPNTSKPSNKRSVPISSSSSESPSPKPVQKINPLKKLKSTMDLSESVKGYLKDLFDDNRAKTAELIRESEDRTVAAVKDQSDLVQSLLKKVNATEAIANHLASEMRGLMKRDKQKNIIVFGVPEKAIEKWSDIESHIADIATKLGMEKIDYDQAFRLGKKSRNTRPILVKLLRTRDRFQIMALRNRLKGTNIYINEDRNAEERKKDAILQKKQVELREAHPKAKVYIKSGILNITEGTGTTRFAFNEDGQLEEEDTSSMGEQQIDQD